MKDGAYDLNPNVDLYIPSYDKSIKTEFAKLPAPERLVKGSSEFAVRNDVRSPIKLSRIGEKNLFFTFAVTLHFIVKGKLSRSRGDVPALCQNVIQ